MPNYFDPENTYLAYGPDETMTIVQEKALADLLRQHGPERLHIHTQLCDGSLEELTVDTTLAGVDDLAKYYVTTLTGARTGLVAEIGWDV